MIDFLTVFLLPFLVGWLTGMSAFFLYFLMRGRA